MSGPLILATPSKGRLKDQVERWLDDCAIPLVAEAGPRGYLARLEGFDDIEVRLASAADIVQALVLGEAHLGVTGEDLLSEAPAHASARCLPLKGLGFGRADLVVATPRSWIDVETMADLDDVAHRFLARTGSRLRVATKYVNLTRAFFARHGIAEYRIVESGGATEGAPAAGQAELVVDIATTGATLAANGLRPLADGLILKSQAQIAASLTIAWDGRQLATSPASFVDPRGPRPRPANRLAFLAGLPGRGRPRRDPALSRRRRLGADQRCAGRAARPV